MTDSRTVRRLKLTSDDGQCAVIDIFEHRLEPAAGRSRDEMIMNLLPMMTRHLSGSFSTHEVSQIAANGLDHPHGTYRPGSVLVIDNPQGEELEAEPVHIGPNGITLVGGDLHDLKTFAPDAYTSITANQRRHGMSNLRSTLNDNPLLALALGAIDAVLPLPYAHRLGESGAAATLAITARAARLVETGRSASGRVAASSAWSDTTSLLHALHWMWVVAPDRGTFPTRLERTADFDEILSICDPELIEAGRRIMKTASAVPVDAITSDAFTTGDDADLSNHERLGLKGQIRALDQAIEDEVPEGRLKPAALKRRKRRAA